MEDITQSTAQNDAEAVTQAQNAASEGATENGDIRAAEQEAVGAAANENEIENENETESIADGETELAAIIEEFPQLWQLESLEQLEDSQRYCELRKMGLSVREAYYAACGRQIEAYAAQNARGEHSRRTQAHLSVAAPRGAAAERIMSDAEKRAARYAIGVQISDSELERLGKKIKASTSG